MQNYSSVARWNVRAVDLENECGKLQTWVSSSSLSGDLNSIVSGLPADFRLDLLTPTSNSVEECECDLCPHKRIFQDSLLNMKKSIESYKSSLSRLREVEQQQQVLRNDSNNILLSMDFDDDEFGDTDASTSLPDILSQFAATAITGVDDRSQGDMIRKEESYKRKIEETTAASRKYKKVEAIHDSVESELLASAKGALVLSEKDKMIAEMQAKGVEKDQMIVEKDKMIAEMQAKDVEKDKMIVEKDKMIVEKDANTVLDKARLAAKDARTVADRHHAVNDKVIRWTWFGNNTLPSFHESKDLTDDRNKEPRVAKNITVFDEGYPKLVVDDASDELKAFHAWLHASLKKPTLIHRLSMLTKSKNAKAVSEIMNWDINANESTNICIPLQALEREVCHPILWAIMYRIASMETLSDNDSSAARAPSVHRRRLVSNNISHERDFWIGKTNPTRQIDFVVQVVEERFRTVLAHSCFVPIEVKPLSRKKVDLAKLHLEGAHQVIGHLAKQIHHYLHLGGVGKNHICRGVVLTMVSVEIIEMELMGVGTRNVTVETRTTKPHFLFDKTTTTRLLKSRFTASSDFQFDESNPVRGFEMLAAALRCPSSEVSPLPDKNLVFRDAISSTEHPLKEYLGAGGFCFVHKLDEGHFVKIPRSPDNREGLEEEGKTLRKLQGWEDELAIKCPYILDSPYPELGIVSFRRFCESSELPALCIAGVAGTAASLFNEYSVEQLAQILGNVKDALVYAHGKLIVHLDVRPSNIIIGVATGFSVQLGDWGCAKSIGAEVKGIRGSVPFAHDEILTQRKSAWRANAVHDFASLSFTMAALIDGAHHKLPWMEFWDKQANARLIAARREKCSEIIARSSLKEADKQFLLENISAKRTGLLRF